VQDLIVGDASKARPQKRFLFDIVANKRNGIDVDKADYLERDAQFCNVKISCDFQRLMRFSQ
ncbi:HD domain-containing protein, partial [Haematococcus lacustris]